MTFEDAAQLDPDRVPGELDRGRWVPVTKSTWRHGRLAGNVYLVLRLYAQKHPGWSISIGDPGTKLGHDPDVLRGPDVGMVREEREPHGTGAEGWLEGAPDLAVEIRGDRQSLADLGKKAREYLEAGGKQVWVIDPDSQHLHVFAAPDRVQILTRDDVLQGGDLLPEFRCLVADLFA
jgi:Uma2 family endonuclease